MAERVGFEPTHRFRSGGIAIRSLEPLGYLSVAEAAGFGPAHAGVKVLCLDRLAMPLGVVARPRFELGTPGLKIRCSAS